MILGGVNTPFFVTPRPNFLEAGVAVFTFLALPLELTAMSSYLFRVLATLALVRVERGGDWAVAGLVVARTGVDFDSTFFLTGRKLFLAGMVRLTEAITFVFSGITREGARVGVDGASVEAARLTLVGVVPGTEGVEAGGGLGEEEWVRKRRFLVAVSRTGVSTCSATMGSETGDTVAPLSSTSGGDDPVLLFGGLSSTDPSEPMLTLELARVRDEEGTLSETRGRELECSYPGEGRVAERFVPRMEPRGETVLGLTPFSFWSAGASRTTSRTTSGLLGERWD